MPEEKYNEYFENKSEGMQNEIDAAINHAKSDLGNLKSEILGFKTPNSINNFYRIEGEKIVFNLNQVKSYLSEVYNRLKGMKNQKFSEISKENNFTGTILAIQITLKALETNPINPKKYNIGKINGEYNELTQNAIKQFQTDCKLQRKDGKPGKETIGIIIKELDNLINNKKLEKNREDALRTDITNIIEESISNNGFSGPKENMVDYIIKGEFNSGKNLIIESQIKILANNPQNNKLKYLLEDTNDSLQTKIQKIKERENKNKILSPRSFNIYTSGENLTEGQKNTITNILTQRRSPVTVKMITDSCQTTNVPIEYLLGFMQNDSRIGTMGLGAITHNPGNVGNTGRTKKDWGTREKGVKVCAENLQKRIDAYLSAKNKNNGKGFNDFPTPEELATGKTKTGITFFGIYMRASNGPKKVAGMVKKWVDRLRGK